MNLTLNLTLVTQVMRERAALAAARAKGGVDHIAANILAVAPLPAPAWDPGTAPGGRRAPDSAKPSHNPLVACVLSALPWERLVHVENTDAWWHWALKDCACLSLQRAKWDTD